MDVISYCEAKKLGLKRYFNGLACSKGHLVERFVSNRGCITCIRKSESGRPARRRAETKRFKTTPMGKIARKRRRDRRRALEAKVEGFFTQADINHILEKQNYRCAGIGCAADFRFATYTRDHKIPLTRGGSNWPWNLQLLCHPCNCKKRHRTNIEMIAEVC